MKSICVKRVLKDLIDERDLLSYRLSLCRDKDYTKTKDRYERRVFTNTEL